MTATTCPCGELAFTEFGSRTPTRVCVCGRIADRCAEDGCDSFGDHQDGTDERLWCAWHCPGAECVADREAEQMEVAV